MPILKRTELVALFNTYARLGSSLNAIQKFRGMVQQAEAAHEAERRRQEAEQAEVIPDWAKKPRHAVVPEPAPSEAVDKTHEEPQASEYQERTIKDEFDAELNNVMDALKFVITGWIRFPSMM